MKETVDVWQEPLETLKRQFGDCEDYAFLTSAVARNLGYRPRFIICSRKNNSHAICIYKKGDQFIWFDNAKIIKTQAGSFLELAQQITMVGKFTSAGSHKDTADPTYVTV